MSEETKENALKQAKMKRRNCKAALTRLGKTVRIQVSGNRPAEEVKGALEKYEAAFSELVSKHEEYTLLIEDDSEFENEEAWLEECQETFLKLKIDTEDYLKEVTILLNKDHSKGSSEAHEKPQTHWPHNKRAKRKALLTTTMRPTMKQTPQRRHKIHKPKQVLKFRPSR